MRRTHALLALLGACLALLVASRVSGGLSPPEPSAPAQVFLTKEQFDAMTQVRTLADVKRLRQQTTLDVFGGPLPTESGLLHGTVLLGNDSPSRKLAIYHAGHYQNAAESPTVRVLQAAGYDVLAVNMPPGRHALLASEPHPLKALLEPVALGLNYAVDRKDYETVIMAGLSGGGWTTVLYSALDPRIRKSYPIAGTVPEYLRKHIYRSNGDYEQSLPTLHVTYIDLYLMAASEGREQFQVFNRHDNCCFSGDLVHAHRRFVEARALELGGRFGLIVDEFDNHELSPSMAWLLWPSAPHAKAGGDGA